MSAEAALVVVDTNVLLAATDRSRGRHKAAVRFLDEDVRRLALSPQIVRKYLAVASRPVADNGLGLPAADAVANIESLLDSMVLLSEDPATTRMLMSVLQTGSGGVGKQVHDANVVAVALAHDASAIVTGNRRHFARFSHLLSIEGLDGKAKKT